MAIAIALTMATPAVPAHAQWNHPLPYAWYVALAQCETSNTLHYWSKSYTGAFGIYRHTFELYADAPNADHLDFGAQARIVDRIAFYGHTEHGRKQWPVGPWGWGSIRHNCNGLADGICTSHNRVVRYWRRNCK